MKVLLINSVCGRGSTGRIVVDIYNNLLSQGHDALIAYGRGQAPEGVNAYRIGSELGVKVHGVLSRLTDRHGCYSTRATKKLLTVINEYKPDIIHLHNLHGYYINVKLLFNYIKKHGIHTVLTLHDCWCFTGHCSYFDMIGCTKWQSQCKNCPQKGDYPSSVLFDRSYSNYNEKKSIFDYDKLTIITPSRWLGDFVKQSFLSNHPLHVIYNGINTDIFKPTKSDFKERYNIRDKKIVLGVADIWSARKGMGDFISLSKMLSDEYRIILVGLKREQIDSLPKNVIGIERTNSAKELAEIYSLSDVYVNFTYSDNFPTTNIEALCCGTPVITYKTGGSPEAVEYGGGFCIPTGDVSCAAEIISKTVFSSLYEECIDASRRYTREHMSAQILSVYEDVLSE